MMTTAAAATMATATATTATATTATITAVTVQQAIGLGVFATAILIGLLVLKELLQAYASEKASSSWKSRAARFYAAHLNIAIMPLAFIFVMIVVTKVATVL